MATGISGHSVTQVTTMRRWMEREGWTMGTPDTHSTIVTLDSPDATRHELVGGKGAKALIVYDHHADRPRSGGWGCGIQEERESQRSPPRPGERTHVIARVTPRQRLAQASPAN